MYISQSSKDWPIKKLTKVYSRFLIEKLSEFLLCILLSAFPLVINDYDIAKEF